MAELQNPDVEEQPALPAAKKSKRDGIPLPTLLIILGVVVAVLVVGLFLAMNVMITSVMDKKMSEAGLDTTSAMVKLQEDNELYYKKIQEKMAMKETMAQLEQEDFYLGDEGLLYAEINQLVAMPKGGTSTIIVSIAFEYRENPMDKAAEGEEEEEKKDDKEVIDSGKLFKERPQLKAKIQSELNNMIGSMTLDEIQAIRPDLENVLTEKMKPIFHKEKIWLKTVMVTQFITS
jgi:flagellar basal body-associated protein FliL